MRLKLVYIYSFVVTLLYLLTACTDGIEASSDSNGQGEGKEIPVSIMPKLVAGDENEVSIACYYFLDTYFQSLRP